MCFFHLQRCRSLVLIDVQWCRGGILLKQLNAFQFLVCNWRLIVFSSEARGTSRDAPAASFNESLCWDAVKESNLWREALDVYLLTAARVWGEVEERMQAFIFTSTHITWVSPQLKKVFPNRSLEIKNKAKVPRLFLEVWKAPTDSAHGHVLLPFTVCC